MGSVKRVEVQFRTGGRAHHSARQWRSDRVVGRWDERCSLLWYLDKDVVSVDDKGFVVAGPRLGQLDLVRSAGVAEAKLPRATLLRCLLPRR